nr:hypothetical protein GCM10020063_013640 [Dactylosporangium thailandense]
MRLHWPDCRNVRDLGGLPAAGVADDVIAEDYACSAVCRDRPGEADPGTILAALERVDELHGGVDAYLLAHGLTGPRLDALRARLVG